MQDTVKIVIDGKEMQYPKGIIYEAIAKQNPANLQDMIALVKVNGKIQELRKICTKDCKLDFITVRDSIGAKTYMRTATLLLVKAFYDVIGKETGAMLKVLFTIGSGYYCTSDQKGIITPEVVAAMKEKMAEYISKDLVITKRAYPIDEANELFASNGLIDKEKVFRYRRTSTVNVYECDGYYDYYYGYMLPSAGYIKYFDLEAYEDGVVLSIPEKEAPTVINPFVPREKLFKTLKVADEWGEKMGISTVGDLNEAICEGRLNDLILIQEALQESRISEIAKDIVSRKGIKFVMIAGPSSSGKTTFSHRLSIQLSTYGLKPHPIAVDDYFVNRDKTPRDENGDYNFECLEAIDVEQFNSDMTALLRGERVELPTFNFKTGFREYRGNFKQLGSNDVLVIEGIHGLNDKMSYALPQGSKYKIYISALTTLNVDEHNRIPTTDGRLIRRMVRDARTRGASAKRTIEMWPSVRRGEEENIFPFQESADAMFNSAQIYELAALKQFAEPLLFSIKPEDVEYDEAKRLLKFLEYFLGMDTEQLPKNSIVREFVGGSCFNA
ncbi:MAG: nucleoside kinase [Lachnospiraceae bacterium]|nr:nucleoside kinase [Lachnospiraceae bacterium]